MDGGYIHSVCPEEESAGSKSLTFDPEAVSCAGGSPHKEGDERKTGLMGVKD
jgi:hypothetical protein